MLGLTLISRVREAGSASVIVGRAGGVGNCAEDRRRTGERSPGGARTGCAGGWRAGGGPGCGRPRLGLTSPNVLMCLLFRISNKGLLEIVWMDFRRITVENPL